MHHTYNQLKTTIPGKFVEGSILVTTVSVRTHDFWLFAVSGIV